MHHSNCGPLYDVTWPVQRSPASSSAWIFMILHWNRHGRLDLSWMPKNKREDAQTACPHSNTSLALPFLVILMSNNDQQRFINYRQYLRSLLSLLQTGAKTLLAFWLPFLGGSLTLIWPWEGSDDPFRSCNGPNGPKGSKLKKTAASIDLTSFLCGRRCHYSAFFLKLSCET